MGWKNVSYEGSNSKYFRLCGLCGLCSKYSGLSLSRKVATDSLHNGCADHVSSEVLLAKADGGLDLALGL